MFRKPRENATTTLQTPYKPPTGRPPTPPSSTSYRDPLRSIDTSSKMASSTMPLLGRSRTLPRSTGRANASPVSTNGKAKRKPNGSILTFFKKAEPSAKANGNGNGDGDGDDGSGNASSLFFGGEIPHGVFARPRSPTPDDLYDDPLGPFQQSPTKSKAPDQDLDGSRYHESGATVKRRKIDSVSPAGESRDTSEGSSAPKVLHTAGRSSLIEDEVVMPKEEGCTPPPIDFIEPVWSVSKRASIPLTDKFTDPDPCTHAMVEDVARKEKCRIGPFIEDSDSDEDLVDTLRDSGGTRILDSEAGKPSVRIAAGQHKAEHNDEDDDQVLNLPKIPVLKQESTSVGGNDDFDGIEDFGDDEFAEEGEEYIERRWIEEQRRLELGLEDEEHGDLPKGSVRGATGDEQWAQTGGTASCPICAVNLFGITDAEASLHVNNCLDGNPTPLPDRKPVIKSDLSREVENGISTAKRFQRAAIAKPGQENPFTLGSSETSPSSAFSKLMSSHAEDAAWATAAAAEMAARGKPAYQRTCPFYKILPGFFICVDAFRYGAVEGCKAYFLSHFHSDHYVGLTSSWCHGPIYCSRVTANLVRQQLRVDPKWVIDLMFDQKVEVPGTQGVEVTMIPANHCPGSSLYLFEKAVGKGKNPKVQRVLHCGDFRACPAHVQHPLLRPDVMDLVTQKQIRQQRIDVCYLDTTYLTPKYAFPSQQEVIKACADMCVSLSKDWIDENDDWEQTKKERAGSGMVKFVRKSSDLIKQEEDEDDIDSMKVNVNGGKKSRGRLLVIVGTYSIGKERICLGVARALNSKIYAPPNKQKICACLDDPELMARLTDNPLEAQVHMQMLMEIRAETLADYLTGYKPHFSRIVGFRPSGWNYRPPNSRFVESPAVQTVLNSENWKSRYSMAELVPQRGSTREASCFGVPYSEHSSFRELTMFCCALRIDKIIPTVNVGSAKSREKMKGWIEKWAMEKKKNGLFKVTDVQSAW